MQKPGGNFRGRSMMFAETKRYPSFSSTLLEKIYSSIDEGCDWTAKPEADPVFYREAEIINKEAYNKTLHEACLLERSFTEKRAGEKFNLQRRQLYVETERKTRIRQDFDADAVCFSTSECSSESSSGGFSSSESEPVIGVGTRRASCFAPLRLKPVRTKAPEKVKKTERALFQEQSILKQGNESSRNGALRSKASKIFEQLKKSKQPISPGGRLVSFINSIFTSSSAGTNGDRSTTRKKTGDIRFIYAKTDPDRRLNRSQAPSCSSASSFTRTRLSKQTAPMGEEIRDGARRTVRFDPVITEDCRHKILHKEVGGAGGGSGTVPVSLSMAWTVGMRMQPRSADQGRLLTHQLTESKHRSQVEEPEKLIRDHLQGQTIGYLCKAENHGNNDDDDDDVISCSSSDLFELPVYETTRVGSNCPIF